MILFAHEYDVDAPEGSEKTGSAYTSRKDVRWIIAIVLTLVIFAYPLWIGLKQQRDKQVCYANMKGIVQAMLLYAEQNGDRLPPLFQPGANGAPMLNSKGRPFVWATLIEEYTNSRIDFACPAAEEDEKMKAIGEKNDLEITYGMFAPMSTYPIQLLENKDLTALLVETSNNGAQGSFDPLPYRDDKGNIVPFSAHVAAFNDSNEELTPTSEWVTRLAFRNVSKGYNSKDAMPRHGKGIHVFTVSGSSRFIKAPGAKVKNEYPTAAPPWRTK